jgi:predicted aconitase
LTTARRGTALDAVVLGSPHLSPIELRAIAQAVAGLRKAPHVRVLLTTNRIARDAAEKDGTLAVCEAFGAEIVTDTCILLAPLLRPEVRTLMTNSAKYAHYSPGLLHTEVVFGSLTNCIQSAVAGRVILDDTWF